jgi:hypothetical protein
MAPCAKQLLSAIQGLSHQPVMFRGGTDPSSLRRSGINALVFRLATDAVLLTASGEEVMMELAVAAMETSNTMSIFELFAVCFWIRIWSEERRKCCMFLIKIWSEEKTKLERILKNIYVPAADVGKLQLFTLVNFLHPWFEY